MMEPDEALDVSNVLHTQAEEMKAELDAAQPRTTREQWQALDVLRHAADDLRSYAVYMTRDATKREQTKAVKS
jgi:hypothetical protein